MTMTHINDELPKLSVDTLKKLSDALSDAIDELDNLASAQQSSDNQTKGYYELMLIHVSVVNVWLYKLL